jgi:hypothetical protein
MRDLGASGREGLPWCIDIMKYLELSQWLAEELLLSFHYHGIIAGCPAVPCNNLRFEVAIWRSWKSCVFPLDAGNRSRSVARSHKASNNPEMFPSREQTVHSSR